jgi:hypothetical protein
MIEPATPRLYLRQWRPADYEPFAGGDGAAGHAPPRTPACPPVIRCAGTCFIGYNPESTTPSD